MITPRTPFAQLPFFTYAGTTTFLSDLNPLQKGRLIDRFTINLSKQLPHNRQQPAKTQYYLIYTIEYHKIKIDGKEIDDHEAPHLHWILYSHKQLPRYVVNGIKTYFDNSYGRTQFYIMTTLKYQQWFQYIQKDVTVNNSLFPNTPHLIEQYLTVELKTQYDDIDNELITNEY